MDAKTYIMQKWPNYNDMSESDKATIDTWVEKFVEGATWQAATGYFLKTRSMNTHSQENQWIWPDRKEIDEWSTETAKLRKTLDRYFLATGICLLFLFFLILTFIICLLFK